MSSAHTSKQVKHISHHYTLREAYRGEGEQAKSKGALSTGKHYRLHVPN